MQVLNYKIQRILLNPHRIRHYHEAQAISEFLKISENWQESGHEDFSTLMLELKGEKNPDIYFENTESRKVFCEGLQKTSAYERWASSFEREAAYKRLSVFGKTAYFSIIVYRKIVKYPTAILRYMYSGISSFVEYRIRIENYKKSVAQNFDYLEKQLMEIRGNAAIVENKVFRKKKKSKTKKNK